MTKPQDACEWCLQPLGPDERGMHELCTKFSDPKATGRRPPTGNQDDDPVAYYARLQEEIGPAPLTPEEERAAIQRALDLTTELYGKKKQQS